MLRLRALGSAPDTRTGLDAARTGAAFISGLVPKLKSTIDALIANGTPEEQAALCKLL